jgi:uncharacterized membrane protein YidH (DUF202 family)
VSRRPGTGPPDDIEDRDPGLARERTDLAWTRTAISFIALGAAMLRSNAVAGAVVILAGAAVWGLGHLSARDTAPSIRRRLHPRHIAPMITAATTLTCLAALVMALLSPHR